MLGSFNFTEGTGAPIAGELFDNTTPGFSPFTARYVRLDVLSNFAKDPAVWAFGDAVPSSGDLTLVGISEIRFDGTIVPEPSCCSLGILGLLSLGLVGRRRARK